MEENIELEEGEACYSKDDDDNIDLDSLSYIDERLQHLLGHFQKDFEGGVSAENLGAKFGGYGSFLPTYERSSCSWSHPKTPQRKYSSPKSPIIHHMEAAFHNTKASSNVPTSTRVGTASHISNSFQNLRVPSVDDSVKKDTGIYSSAVAERCTLKDDTKNKAGNSTDQRTLKFRIKVKPNILAQKKAAIYSGLGLDNSPSSSMGNSPEESEGMLPVSQENVENSPTGIIQLMTSFPIPGGGVISPLPDSLLYLIRKETIHGDSISISSLNSHKKHGSMFTDESDSFVEDMHLDKKKVKILRQNAKQLESNHMTGTCYENDMTLHTKKRLGNRTPDRMDFLSNDLKSTPLSSSICDAGETAEVTDKASAICKEVNKDSMKGRVVSVDAVKEESLESISGQDFDKIGKHNTGYCFMENVLEHKLENSCKDTPTNPKNSGKCDTYMISKKVKRDAIKCKANQDPQKSDTNQKGKAVSEGKNKSKGDQSPRKAETGARKDSFGAGNDAMVTDKESAGLGITSCGSKMSKIKPLKDNKVSDINRDWLKGKKSEWKVHGPLGDRAMINANHDKVEKQSAYGVKVKERPSGNKVVNQSFAGLCIKDDSGAVPIAEHEPAPEMVSSAVAVPQLIAEDWVCCDSCQKWRLLPTGIKPEQLPEKWLCSMLNWLPGMNRCNISEEETTKALYALYQVPISEGQNNMQNHAAGTAIGVSSGDALQSGLNHKKSSSDVLSGRGKKKHLSKEKTMPRINKDMLQYSNSAKMNAQEPGKNRSLTDMNKHPVNSNPMKKTNSKHYKFNNLIEEKHMPKEKEKQINGGDRKQIKLKRKMDADQYRLGTPKKLKTADVFCADKHRNPDMDREKVGLNSRDGLPTKASGKDMRKHDEYCLSEDVQDKLLVPEKKEDQAQVSSGGGSSDRKNSSKRDGSMKKRKSEDWLDNEKHKNTFSLQVDKCGEDGNESGFSKEKKYRVLNTEAESVTEGDDKLNRGGGVRQVFLSGGRDQMAVGTEVRCVDKAQQPRKRRKNIASHQALDGIDPLCKDLGSGQLSLAATSSSSKISGSHKVRTGLEDVRSSPVESVTSSPSRTSNLDKHILAAGDTSGKHDATKGGVSLISSWKGADNREGKQSIKMKEGRILNNLHPACHKFPSIDQQVVDAKEKARVQAKASSEVKNDHLLEGGVPIEQEQCENCANGVHHHEEKVNKNNQESALSWQKCGKVTSLCSKEKDKRSGSQVGMDKIKVSASENVYSKNDGRYDFAVDPSYHATGHETRNDTKYSSPRSKCENDDISLKNALRHRASETGKQSGLKQKDFENSVLQVDAPFSTNRKIVSQQNPTQDFEEENKANPVCTESRDGKFKVFSSAVVEVKRETSCMDSRTAHGYQKGDISNGHPVHVSGNGDVAKLMGNSADVGGKVGINSSSRNLAPDRQITFSSPMRTHSSQTAFNTLEKATKLKDTADHYKNSGFEFESNETYFEAALKFLHGASLLENCHSEGSKHGGMNQMQIYATTAKLFKSCANEYERCQEMAAAALAYKCMEVAYMRVVHCKHSSINRDRHELRSTLQMVSQGESPSSSASDVDNLNNQAAVDKATLPRGTNTHVGGNQVISARARSNLVWLLDFTQDIDFAMEASRKCQSTSAAANVIMEEARSRDCITSLRRVVDFSFQDVDELVRLVGIATKAISRAGLGGARD